MYQVIARTWRPQKFSEVIGQRHVTQTLQNAIRLNRIGHGYIFSGQRGVGKTTVARLLAKALNCQKGPSPEPCGECDSCKEIAAGRSVDVIEIDAASNRGIDAVRELRENARYAPARDRYKIFIIDEAHQITPEGFNALLKTLEEPPEHVIFLLATTEAHQFPETILSRCQHFSLHALTYAEILGHLEKVCASEKVEADPEALAVLAKSGQGSLRDALSRLEQVIAAFGSRLEGSAVRQFLGEPPSSLMEEVFSAIIDHKREAMLAVVEKLVEEGYQLQQFCSQLVRATRNLLVIRVAGSDPRLLESLLECSAEETQRLAALAESFTEESLMRFLAILLQLHQELRFSMEPRLQMELGLLKLVDAEKLVDIEDLLAQMEKEQGPPVARPLSVSSGRSDVLGWKPGSTKETESLRLATTSRQGPGEQATGNREQIGKLSSAATTADQSPRSGKLSPLEEDLRRKKQFHDPSAIAEVAPTGTAETSIDTLPSSPLRDAPLEMPESAAHFDSGQVGTGALGSKSGWKPGQASGNRFAGDKPEASPSGMPGATNAVATAVDLVQRGESELSQQEQGWIDEIVGRLEEQSRPFLASILPAARGWEFGEDVVKIRLAEEALLKAILDSDRQFLEQVCAAVLGRKVKVSLGNGGENRLREVQGQVVDVGQTRRKHPIPQNLRMPDQSGGTQDSAGDNLVSSGENRVRQDPEIAEFEKLFGKRVEVICIWRE